MRLVIIDTRHRINNPTINQMAATDTERVSRLEGAYEHMASKAELSDLNGKFKSEYVRTRMRLDSIEEALQTLIGQMAEMQQNILVMQDAIVERIERSNARMIGFQT